MLALIVAAAVGCSLNTDVAKPEALVRDADQIVLAKAVKFTPDEKPTTLQGHVTFEVLEVLKGAKVREVTVAGWVEPYFGANDQQAPYTFVRPGGRRGICYAFDYKLGATFLLLMKKGTPNWSGLAPTNEEVKGADDPWVKWVRARLDQAR